MCNIVVSLKVYQHDCFDLLPNVHRVDEHDRLWLSGNMVIGLVLDDKQSFAVEANVWLYRLVIMHTS